MTTCIWCRSNQCDSLYSTSSKANLLLQTIIVVADEEHLLTEFVSTTTVIEPHLSRSLGTTVTSLLVVSDNEYYSNALVASLLRIHY